MNTTRHAIKERMKSGVDVVIELLDARLPGSSTNPLLAELTAGKPHLKVLNKQDLADPACTQAWLAHFNALPDTRALPLDTAMVAPAKALVAACRALAPLRGGMAKPLRVLICGVPNVGKSTLINTLSSRKATKTGDEAGITKVEQKIVLESDVYLFDTPGMLWPRIAVPSSGYNLAASGAVGRNAYDEEEVALELLGYLRRHYAAQLTQRYTIELNEDASDEDVLAAIGRRRGAVQSGGRVNLQKASEVLIFEFRQGVLGPMTLERPQEFAQWQASAMEADALKQARDAQRKRKARVNASAQTSKGESANGIVRD